ncbi:hypothetical protein CHS0354_042408 [Potamilus streckersoni]|uniref:Uncharacterized protein n=1 Tax=Potamilus streckersoni TaxID=2493646 RepID=A0AAE0STW1_9BIVA|nr:hypothetical protein CHS0354_042408 [Potamilus streckersoni]
MDVVTRISVLLLFIEIGHSKELNPTISVQGDNATVSIHAHKTEGETLLEINFSGYISNEHFSNIMIYRRKKGESENISINRNYTGRIDRIEQHNDHFSFLLINVMFYDSGNYKVNVHSKLEGNTIILVARRIYVANIRNPSTLSFVFYDLNASSITVDNPTSKLTQPVLIYNATNDSCIYTDAVSVEKINCVLRKGEFSFIIPEIGWLHKGSYFAWDDKGRLLDSLFLDIQDTTITKYLTTTSSLDTGQVNPLLYVVLSMGGILAAVFIAYIRYKITICLRADRESNRNTLKDFNRDDGNECLPERSSLGNSLTIRSNKNGELSTELDMDCVQVKKVTQFGQNVVPAQNEHSLKLDCVQVNDGLDGYLSPIHSRSVEVDYYIHPLSTCPVESDDYIHVIHTSPV